MRGSELSLYELLLDSFFNIRTNQATGDFQIMIGLKPPPEFARDAEVLAVAQCQP